MIRFVPHQRFAGILRFMELVFQGPSNNFMSGQKLQVTEKPELDLHSSIANSPTVDALSSSLFRNCALHERMSHNDMKICSSDYKDLNVFCAVGCLGRFVDTI